jgi:hypothetical protein
MNVRYLWALLCSGILSAACGNGGQIPSVEREDLFSLDIGRLEDQIALYDLEGDQGIRRTDMAMRDGLFYISDASGGKILRYNSYGDLLFMIYNEETNPRPLTLKPLQEGSVITRWAVSYPLHEPGEITVDSRKHIYVRDRLPYDMHGFDAENKALLDSVILHFDENGRFVKYLGRDGIGGSPFPRIIGLFTSLRDELAVVCRLPTGWNIYWFDSNGAFLFIIPIKNDAVPVPHDRDMVIPSLDSIAVAPDSRHVYIKVDYYRDTYDESTNTRTGNEPDSSVIWIMNADTGEWVKTVEAPFFEYTYTENNRKFTTRMLYSMLGVIQKSKIFLSFPVDGGYSLLFLSAGIGDHGAGGGDLNSAVPVEQRRAVMQVSNDELQFNVFYLSPEGILSGLLVDDWKVKLTWWRTDKIIDSDIFIGEGHL